MSAPRRRWWPVPLALLVVVAGVALVADVIRRAEALPRGPVAVVWDRTSCAECRMSVSDQAWAAQLQTKDGRVLDFDDPGCLFRFQAHDGAAAYAVYFRDVRGDRWLPEAEAAFLETGPSPMGYDLGAVPAGTPGALTVADARATVTTEASHAQ